MSVDVREVWLGRGALYFPALRYEYRVGQAQLMGSRVGYATRFPAFSHATAMYVLRRDYPKGSAVTVRYDPTNPHEAILEPGLRVALQSLVLVGSLFIIVAIIAVTFGRSTT